MVSEAACSFTSLSSGLVLMPLEMLWRGSNFLPAMPAKKQGECSSATVHGESSPRLSQVLLAPESPFAQLWRIVWLAPVYLPDQDCG